MGHVLVPLAEDYEDSELSIPLDRLRQAGHQTTLVGSDPGCEVTGKRGEFRATVQAKPEGVEPHRYDGMLIPGGYSPDHLRIVPEVVDLVRRFCESGKPVAAICHGPQLLIEAEVVRGRNVTSWPSVRKDLENAGANWTDRPVVEDEWLITSRKPDDLDAFCDAFLARLDGAEVRRTGPGI